MSRARRRAALCLLLPLLACESGPISRPPSVPGTARPVEVQSVVERSEYLDAVLVGESFSGRRFFPRTGDCPRLLVAGEQRQFRNSGPWGRVDDDEGSCNAVGIGALAHWRNQHRTPRNLSNRRAPARFRVVFTDQEYALARGRFPLATAVFWSMVQDTIAVIPRSVACSEPLERGHASMEYRRSGPEALVLISTLGTCPIEGLVTPLSNPGRVPEPESSP